MFEFIHTEIEDLTIIKPHIYRDSRGVYKKYFEKDTFAAHGIDGDFSECSDIYSAKGALRGLHYQTVDSQSKLIHVVKGKLFDVALDLRPDSATFGQFHAELLSSQDDKIVYIPRGFAHGFITLENDTIFSYQCSGKYLPEYCGGIRWDDPKLGIPWPLTEFGIEKIVATEKDLSWPTLEEYIKSGKAAI